MTDYAPKAAYRPNPGLCERVARWIKLRVIEHRLRALEDDLKYWSAMRDYAEARLIVNRRNSAQAYSEYSALRKKR